MIKPISQKKLEADIKRKRKSTQRFLEKFRSELEKHKGQLDIRTFCDLKNKALEGIVSISVAQGRSDAAHLL